jgi:hypothetical protein
MVINKNCLGILIDIKLVEAGSFDGSLIKNRGRIYSKEIILGGKTLFIRHIYISIDLSIIYHLSIDLILLTQVILESRI